MRFGRISVAEYLAITAPILHLTAMFSNSWLLVERVESSRCHSNKITVNEDCVMTPYRRSEIARAGLWTVCYSFPHVEPPGHTDPYCADFVEDIYRVEGLTTIQILCSLSTCLAMIGSFLIGCSWLLRCNDTALSSAAFSLLAISGLCGLVGCSYVHIFLTKEYLVYYDPSRLVLYKWWAFHVFLDGSIVSLAAWFINSWINRRYRFACRENVRGAGRMNEKSRCSLAGKI